MTYLAKDGKVSGPFENEELNQLKASGEYYAYEWMWDGKSPDWYPVPRKLHDAPPLPLPSETTGPKLPPLPGGRPSADRLVPAKPPATPGATANLQATPATPLPQSHPKLVHVQKSTRVFPAIIFDNRQSIGGEVSDAHAQGGKFVSTLDAGSHFPRGAKIFIDVLDESNDKSAKIKASIKNVNRVDAQWIFELEWSDMPLL